MIKCFKEENPIENMIRNGQVIRELLLDNFWNIYVWVLSTSISPETVWQDLRAAGLNRYSACRNFFVIVKNRRLGFYSKN